MARYMGQLLYGAVGTAFKSMGAGWNSSASARRISIYEFDLGLAGALNTSNDTQVLFDVTRFTSTSLLAGTAFTPSPNDPSEAATLSSWVNNCSVEVNAGNLAAAGAGLNMLNPPINQRGTFRWRALDDGDNIVLPTTQYNGIAIRVLSLSYTGTAIGTVMYIE